MGRKLAAFLLGFFVLFMAQSARADEGLSPYLKIGVLELSATDAAQKVGNALGAAGFSIIGEYHPEGKPNLMVVAYTRQDMQEAALKTSDRGFLAAVLKVGIKEENKKSTVSMVNPEYLFRAYLMKNFEANREPLLRAAAEAKEALKTIGGEPIPFGGTLTAKDLQHYHYMFGMEYFDNPVVLKKFSSFEEGMQTITKNLSAQKGSTMLVYSLINENTKTAVFGVGLGDAKTGEPFFLPVIGDDHLSAMPYEMILSNDTATMLHGRFRIALHWPSLTMGTFTRIISTPGAIERAMRGLTE